jgi:hypothetical protein
MSSSCLLTVAHSSRCSLHTVNSGATSSQLFSTAWRQRSCATCTSISGRQGARGAIKAPQAVCLTACLLGSCGNVQLHTHPGCVHT